MNIVKRGIFARAFIYAVFMLLALMPLVLQIAVVSGQEPSVPYGLSPEQIEDRMTQLEALKNITQWQLIGEKFKLNLLRTPVISWLDAGFTKASWVFSFLFGMPYSLTVTLLLVIGFWAWLFIEFGGFFNKAFKLSASSSYGISFATCVIFGQVGIFENLINALGTLIFAREAWLSRIVLIFMFLGLFYLLHYISRLVGKELEKRKELQEKLKTTHAGKVVQAEAEGLKKGKEIVENA